MMCGRPVAQDNPTVAAVHHAALHQCRTREPYCPGCGARLVSWLLGGGYDCHACYRPVYAPDWRVEPECPYPHEGE